MSVTHHRVSPPPAYLAGTSSHAGRQAASQRNLALRGLTAPLAAWHLLSLDAPTVAVCWLLSIARAAHVTLPWTQPASMFLAVWILYAADRLLDARSLRARAPGGGSARNLEARHFFHAAHRRAFSAGLLAAASALLLLLRCLAPAVLHWDLLLGSLLFLWLLLVHSRTFLPMFHARLPKELVVGVFFSAAVFLPAVALSPAVCLRLLPLALLFAAVCSLNCVYIFAWEHPSSLRHAHGSTEWALRRLRPLCLSTAGVGVTLAGCFLARSSASQPSAYPVPMALLALACSGSALLLVSLHWARRRLQPVTLRAAADLCLLTPALLWLMLDLTRR